MGRHWHDPVTCNRSSSDLLEFCTNGYRIAIRDQVVDLSRENGKFFGFQRDPRT